MTKKRDAKGQLRDYKKEAKYQSKPALKKYRAELGKARTKLEKAGKVRKGDGKELDHKKMRAEGGSNDMSNIQVVSRHKNRTKQPKHKSRRG